MEMCNDCLHKELCIYRARALLSGVFVVEECESYLAPSQHVDIYEIADSVTSTVKQVLLAHLRTISDTEED